MDLIKNNLKDKTFKELIVIQTKVANLMFDDNNKILVFENLTKIKIEFLNFFEEFQKEQYNEEYFFINIKRIMRFFQKDLVLKTNTFLDKLQDKKMSKKSTKNFYIKFLVFVK